MTKFVKVAKLKDIPPGSRKLVEVDGLVVALFNLDGRICAIEDMCTHDGGPLAEGDIVRPGVIACPRHGAEFDICTGAALTLPAVEPARTFTVKVEKDTVYVEKPFA